MKAVVRYWCIVCFSMLEVFSLKAQNVGINATGATPNGSAGLDIDFANKGLLIPRVALTATNSNLPIGAGVATSLLVYNTATAGIPPFNVVPGFYYWNGTSWVSFASGATNNWTVLGNAGTLDGTNFLGTTDNVPFNFKVNNQKAGRIDHLLGATFLGYQAGNSNLGNYNTGFGYQSLFANTTGTENTGVGYLTLQNNTIGFGNLAMGFQAMNTNTTGSYNAAFGHSALQLNATGYANTSGGYYSLRSNTSGAYNSAYGYNSLYQNTTGNLNTSMGASAMGFNSTGGNNTACGYASLGTNTTGSNNTAVGSVALYQNTTASENTAVGANALEFNLVGSTNSAIGRYTMRMNTSGSANSALGYSALLSNTNGANNTAIGYGALQSNTTAASNTAVGHSALFANTTSAFSTAVGERALFNSSGGSNTAVGYGAGSGVLSGTNNSLFGAGAQVPFSTMSNQVRIGNTAVTYAGVQVAWTITSDARWKTQVTNTSLGLAFIKGLRPVDYVRIIEDSAAINGFNSGKQETGFIAQEVNEWLKQCGYSNSGMVTTDENGYYGIRYNDLIPVLVKAIQEQDTKINALLQRVKELEQSGKNE